MAVSETFRLVVIVFFATHIPATILMDSQALLPPSVVPSFARALLRFHCEQNADPLMADPPVWFKSFILFELLFQLPFFFVGLRAFTRRENWIRIPGICYGAHTATTLIPILASILHAPEITSDAAWCKLFFIYLPYLVIPAWMTLELARHEKPFGNAARRASRARKQE